jgi:Tol biopolymer transport system component/formylglycine-generating enzyme required for sulfatase activity
MGNLGCVEMTHPCEENLMPTRYPLLMVTILFILLTACGSAETTAMPVPATAIPIPTPTQAVASIPPTLTPTDVLHDSRSGVIAFTSEQDGNMEIYIMSADVSDLQQLTDHPAEDYWPTWSPDGAQIAFTSERDGDFEIYAVNADGSNLRRLTQETGNDLEPAWSPDGAKIAFMRYHAGKSDIYIMKPDGSQRQRLTEGNGDNYLPKWSPDGAQIIFVSERDGNPEIYLMNADGSDQRRITDNPSNDLYPSWSPDGAQISFSSNRDGNGELYVMDADGRNPQPLTHNNAPVWVSDWSPDGGRIAFTSNRDGNREIYIMDTDGSNLQRLTDNNVLDGIPAWRPANADTAAVVPTAITNPSSTTITTAGLNNTPPPLTLSFVENGQKLGPAHSWDVALGDLDSDGDLDVFTANDSHEGNKIWFNDGQGLFTMSEQTLEPCLRVGLGDLDGDSDLDAVVTNWDAEKDNWLSDASVWLNDGTGNFSKNQGNLGGDEVFNLALGDLNGDGELDIFFAAISFDTVWLNDGNGSFTDTGQRLKTGIDAAVVLGDLDQDGDLDALTGGWEGSAQVWLNDGLGNFVSNNPNMTGSNLHIHDLSLGDFDGDGDLDAFAAIANGGPHEVWLNDGAGLFSQFQSLSAPLAHGISLGDIDGDGDIDAVTAHGAPTGGHARIWLNDGNGSFADSQLRLGSAFSSAIALGDLDNDGDLDAFTTHTQWGQRGNGEPAMVWLNENSASTRSPPDTANLGDSYIRPSDGMTMFFVPAGSFLMGSSKNDPDASSDEYPQHEVKLDSFWIDQTEITNAQYNLCVDLGGCRKSRYANNAAYNRDDYPAVGVAWQDAVDYCTWAGGRLPTEAEWEYAARGEGGFIYPWGNEFDGSLVNFCDMNCEEGWADKTIDDGYEESAPAGSFPGGASWVGALDMAGNVWEWTWDWCESYSSGLQINPNGPENGRCKIIRGGAWASPPSGIRTAYRISGSTEIAPGIRHPNIGFRCLLPIIDSAP